MLPGPFCLYRLATVVAVVEPMSDLMPVFLTLAGRSVVLVGGGVRRDGVTLAISTNGIAPALAGLLREALDAVLPRDLAAWVTEARRQRPLWRRDGVPMEKRRPLLLQALNRLYGVGFTARP